MLEIGEDAPGGRTLPTNSIMWITEEEISNFLLFYIYCL